MEQQLVPYKATTMIEGTRVLVLAPHPDDEIFGCGGAIMRHVSHRQPVKVIICSDGAYRPDASQQATYAALRRSESIQAATVLGYGEPDFWGLPDRGLEYGEFLVQRIQHAIETFHADLLYAPSIHEMHPDHRALAMAAVEAARRHGSPLKLAMYEVGVPMLRPSLLLDISDLRERKQQAMACFLSQLKEQAYDKHITALNTFRTYTLGPRVTAAEAYFLASAAELETGVLKLYESEHQRQQQLGIPMTATDVPLVSILMRSMDRDTLKVALDSVALQTYSNIEVVVVNAKGGSHTLLGDWCGRFPLRLITRPQPLQRSRAANVALKEARGQHLIFLDDDDWFAPHHINALVEGARQNTQVRAIYSNVQVVGAEGEFQEHIFRPEFDPLRMMADNQIPIHAILFNQSLVALGCVFDEKLDVYEDWDFWLQVSRHTTFFHIDEVGAYYCASGRSDVGLKGMEDARKKAREVVFEKWKTIWSGEEINALLARKDFLSATKVHELEWDIHVVKDQSAAAVRLLEAQLQSKAEDLSHQKNLLHSREMSLREAESQNIELHRRIDEFIHSSSWRLTKPLRWAKTRASHVKHLFSPNSRLSSSRTASPLIASIRLRGFDLIKQMFHTLPISKEMKATVRNFCYESFPALFRSVPSYKFWLMRQTMQAPKFSGGTAPASSRANLQRMLPAPLRESTTQPLLLETVDIIVPVYRGLEQTRRCIESVLSSVTNTPFRLIVINDSSPEEAVTDYLRSVSSSPRVTLIENPENLGFTATVNLGMSLSDTHDVVLLNSDTEVANDWLDRLTQHAHSSPKIGTITPFSSNATICNYPTLEGMKTLPKGETTQTFDAAFASANSGRHIEIPTAVGFCMYIRRTCLTDVGLFDVETFGKGYGEENDFCLRATAKGWKHLLAADTFVFHEGEVSFQAGSNPRKERAMQILRGRYPSYEADVAEHVTLNEAYPLRVAATAARFRTDSLPVVLHILHGHGGGTEKHVEELCRSFLGKARLLIMYAPVEQSDNPEVRLRSADPFDALDLLLPTADLELLTSFLQSFGVSLVHIHHVLDYPMDLRALIVSLGVPFYLTVHDYFLICPRINLMPPKQKYCGEPGPSQCNACLSIDAPRGAVDILWWRASHAWLFEGATAVICPSNDVANRCRRYFPDAAYQVVSHEKMTSSTLSVANVPVLTPHEPLRIAILGVLARHKGLTLISDALDVAVQKNSPLEFRLIGFSEQIMPHFPTHLFSQTGPYDDSHLADLIDAFNPHLILFPACWPETYSYTLTVALNSQRPIMVTDIGALTERVTSRPWTWLIDWNTSPSHLVEQLESIRKSNFQINSPPSLPMPEVSSTLHEPQSPEFYDTDYLPSNKITRSLAPVSDLRTTGKITAMVLVENAGSEPSPCAYIRLILPLLQEQGNQLKICWVKDKDVCSYQADVLIIQRTAVTALKHIDAIVHHCRQNAIQIVYDLDDLLLRLPKDHPEQAVYAPKAAAVARWLSEANEVWVSTEALGNRVAEVNSRVQVLPNYLERNLWAKPIAPKKPHDTVRLLYMGTQTHQADFDLVKTALHRIKKEFTAQVEVFLIGVTSGASSDKWYQTIPVPDNVGSNYPAFVNWMVNGEGFDIGITPLVDNEFNRCKSAIKFLDYSALGMVTVASDLGVYTPIRQGDNGFLVPNDEESWYLTLKKLIADPELLRRVGLTAQTEVSKSYGYERMSGCRTRLLSNLLSKVSDEVANTPSASAHQMRQA